MYRVKRRAVSGVQAGCSTADLKDQGIQCSYAKGSYKRDDKEKNFTSYDDLLLRYLWDRDYTLSWLKAEGLIASSRTCGTCGSDMKWEACGDRSDGYVWQCRKQINGKRHWCERSIREGSWFENANMTLEEVMKFTYWWCQDLDQWQIKKQLGIGSHAAVDWDMFCREVCEVTLFEKREKIGGPGKLVQIDESKIGKRKYHRGHVVEGQWVFSGIEEDSQKSFIETVENRTEETLLNLIREWVAPGTVIVSDGWRAYANLGKHGYIHKTLNHSIEFVNKEGFHTNKIEGHSWQKKAKLPTHGRKKEHYSSYLAEFKWRYVHRGEDLWKVFLDDVKRIYQFK
ncbi:uncharacterized protein LOC114960844 [Acropora millepora]|uniref:uncharacterized protein LOC114960844 n=1 Tax=Acropora millepora TaxID=45264 RepID=UPI001CF5FC97|nr:uncharacterized protein LOC114960844 [Acropora millepora]